jgi:hypothetical protein
VSCPAKRACEEFAAPFRNPVVRKKLPARLTGLALAYAGFRERTIITR